MTALFYDIWDDDDPAIEPEREVGALQPTISPDVPGWQGSEPHGIAADGIRGTTPAAPATWNASAQLARIRRFSRRS